MKVRKCEQLNRGLATPFGPLNCEGWKPRGWPAPANRVLWNSDADRFSNPESDALLTVIGGPDSIEPMEAHIDNLIGLGLYTPAEAGRFLHIPAARITRWLRGHGIGEQRYSPLWIPQIDLNDGHVYLGFRDLMEVRIADKFISSGLSPQRVRAAIRMAQDIIGDERPLSTDRFRTDGREIFFRVIEKDETAWIANVC